MVINISQTEDKDRDITSLNKVISILKDYPGQDEVKLSITGSEKVTNLKEGSCILTSLATNEVISSYVKWHDGLNDMAKREYEDTLLDIKEYTYINDKIREY